MKDSLLTNAGKLLARYDGLIRWRTPVHLESRCSFDLQYWPRDRHYCTLNFATWTISNNILFQLKESTDASTMVCISYSSPNVIKIFITEFFPKLSDDFIKNSEWDILGPKLQIEWRLRKIFMTIQLQRISPSYHSTILLPCLSKFESYYYSIVVKTVIRENNNNYY